MKIKKIKSISNIGSFSDFTSPNSNALELERLNIFFGENGNGKSTISTIIQSLDENKTNLIIQRKRFNCTEEPKCTLELEEGIYLFKEGNWEHKGDIVSTPLNRLIVFNEEYVQRNFFSEKFEHAHKVNMHKIIFGEKGIEINEKLLDIKQKIESLKLNIGISDMTKIKSIHEIPETEKESHEKKMDELNLKISNSINKKEIIEYAVFSQLQEIDIDFKELRNILSIKLDSESHVKAKQLIEGYKNTFFEESQNYEGFINLGIRNIKNNNCPFCHTTLTVPGILDEYKKYFDEEYKTLKRKMVDEINKIINFNIPHEIQKLKSIESINNNLFSYWKLKTEIKEIIGLDRLEDLEILKKELDLELKNKLENLDYVLNDEKIVSFEDKLNEIKIFMQKVNGILEINNALIHNFKKELGGINISELEEEKKDLKLIIERFSTKKELFNKIIEEKILEQKAKEELNAYTESVSEGYISSINEKLIDLGIRNIKLSELKSVKHSLANEVSTEITLEIDSNKINMKSHSEEVPAFNNTLSNGEKNALSFAFFMCQLEGSPNLSEKIIIFDDPLTSLDDNRKNKIASSIKSIKDKTSQIIIFTHKNSFLKILNKENKENVKFFELKKDDTSGSQILILNMDERTKEEYIKIIEKLDKFTREDFDYPNLENDLRKAFEKIISTKYHIRKKDINGTIMTHSTLNSLFWENGKLLEIKDRLGTICNISNEGSHSGDSSQLIYSDMPYAEKKDIVIESLEMMEKV